jgi:acyl carrier protein
MNADEREAWVRTAITKACRNPAEDVGPNEDLQSAIGLDSLGKLEVLAAIEDEFDFLFDDDALSSFTTVQRILDVVDKKLACRAEETT